MKISVDQGNPDRLAEAVELDSLMMDKTFATYDLCTGPWLQAMPAFRASLFGVSWWEPCGARLASGVRLVCNWGYWLGLRLAG